MLEEVAFRYKIKYFLQGLKVYTEKFNPVIKLLEEIYCVDLSLLKKDILKLNCIFFFLIFKYGSGNTSVNLHS